MIDWTNYRDQAAATYAGKLKLERLKGNAVRVYRLTYCYDWEHQATVTTRVVTDWYHDLLDNFPSGDVPYYSLIKSRHWKSPKRSNGIYLSRGWFRGPIKCPSNKADILRHIEWAMSGGSK